MAPSRFLIGSLFCIFLCNCSKSPPSESDKTDERIRNRIQEETRKTEIENRIEEEAAKIAAARERLAELQQQQREKVAAELASRTETREAARAANLERAAAEQARREGITAELKAYIDGLRLERSVMTDIVRLNVGGQEVEPGYVLVSPAGYSVKYVKKDGDYWWFTYDEDAFALTLRKTLNGLAAVEEIRAKRPLAEGFQVGQTLPEIPSGDITTGGSTSSRGLLVLKATYGAGQTQRDVKDLVKSKIQNGRLDFRAHSGELGGDPAFGQVKTFYIKYVANGRALEKNFREGEHVSLP